MVAIANTAGEPYTVPVPPATAFEGRVTPGGRRPASLETVDRRRANRRARPKSRPVAHVGTDRVEVAMPPDPYLLTTDVRPTLWAVTCSEPWVEEIGRVLGHRRPNGKPVVPYAVRPGGKLATSPVKLIEMLAEHGVYPPIPADPANRMRPCCCDDCASAVGRLARLYPAIYVDRGLSFECRCNRRDRDEVALAELDPDAAYLLALSRVRERDVQTYDDNPASGRRQPRRIVDRYDAVAPAEDIWRHEKLDVLGIESRTATDALRAHRWTHVGGTVKAKLVKRRLTTVGDLYDFIHVYGRSLGEVVGLSAGMGAGVRERLAEYQEHGRALTAAEREKVERGQQLVSTLDRAMDAGPSAF